jgi:kinesin family member 2/24
LYDLLNSRSELKIREDAKQNINVIGLEERTICSANEFLDVIEYGSNFRVTSQNATNADSSRSHAILQITLKNDKKPFTKISFIDLAGN